MGELLSSGVGKAAEWYAQSEDEGSVEHHCGIVGVYQPLGDPVKIVYRVLQHLNHRGQEGSMIAVQDADGSFDKRGGAGWVSQAYTASDIAALQAGNPTITVGQNRYSTSGVLDVYQPFVAGFGGFSLGDIAMQSPQMLLELAGPAAALVHNGNLTNAMQLKDSLPAVVQSLAPNDTGVAFLQLYPKKGRSWDDRIRDMVAKCEGSANFIIAADQRLFAWRDPWGFRPLWLGKIPSSDSANKAGYVVASEDGAMRAAGAIPMREIYPGEGIVISDRGVETFFMDPRVDAAQLSQCIFEIVYFAAPDALIFGKHVSEIRRKIGALLARKDAENGFLPDVVVPVQHSGIPFAEGYAAEIMRLLVLEPERFGLNPDDKQQLADRVASLQTRTGLVANMYAQGRSFIAPGQRVGINTVKHRADRQVVGGKKVAVIDDSLVRGSTSRTVNMLLKEAGATEVHSRFGYPPVRHPCFMGVDFSDPGELIVNRVGDAELAGAIGANSIHFVTPHELLAVVMGIDDYKEIQHHHETVVFQRAGFCGSCIFHDPSYPTDVRGVYRKTT